MSSKSRIHVISLGGSLVFPKTGIDTAFLKRLRQFVMKEVDRGARFIFVVGGGAVCRQYQNAARCVVSLADEDLDWMGVHATRMNGHLLRTIFRDIALHRVVKDPTRKLTWNRPVLIAAGWKPGWSTDYIAVRMAKKFGVDTVINMSNIPAVHDKDPNKHRNTKAIDRIDWKSFRKMVGSKWEPGANTPFDPIASKLAASLKMRVYIVGKDLKNLANLVEGRAYTGTVIEPS